MGWLSFLFGGGRNVVAETAEVFRVNSEKQASRLIGLDQAVLAQYAAEYHSRQNRTWIDALADGLNRLVRPVLTLAIFAPLALTIYDPTAMAEIWLALATVPSEFWVLQGVVISFYFGGRMQMKALGSKSSFEASAAALRDLAAEAQDPVEAEDPDPVEASKPAVAEAPAETVDLVLPETANTGNAAIDEWIALKRQAAQ